MKDGLKAGTFTEVSPYPYPLPLTPAPAPAPTPTPNLHGGLEARGARRAGRGARQPAQQVLQAALVRALLHMRYAAESAPGRTTVVAKYGIYHPSLGTVACCVVQFALLLPTRV